MKQREVDLTLPEMPIFLSERSQLLSSSTAPMAAALLT
jgi:hypothetical protein